MRAEWYTITSRCTRKHIHYELDPAYFSLAPGLARGACLKKTEIELELLKIKDMILLVEKYIRGGMCHAIHWNAKASKKYMKDYDRQEVHERLWHMYWDVNKFYGWVMSQKLPVHDFGSRKKVYVWWRIHNTVTKNTYLKLMLSILRNYMSYTVICRSYLKEWISKNVKNLCVICMTRETM